MTTAAKEIPSVDLALIEKEASPFVQRALALKVTTRAEDEDARRAFLSGKGIEKFIKTLYEGPKKILDKAHKDLVAQEKEKLGPIQSALRIIEGHCLAFKRIEEAKAAKLQAELAEQARREEEERQLALAIEAEDAGDKQAAAEILDQPTTTAAIVVKADVGHVQGVGTKRTWGAEVFDKAALIKHVAAKCDEDPGCLAWLDEAMPALNSEARNKKHLLSIPGVRAVEREGLSGRTIA